ncbi:hypothetical protein TRAPUB_1880 [Trametes pubescens]|uniref:Uncharacterized protein n=1 Tax=Trametes pubescens TaxID=154538 RepID=A0A1M2VI29_TRAPU|nr:hypothetical protein TRAPUB_1880 [Trametes pubescens]
MHAKIFATLLLSVLAANALPAKRDAKELLDVVNSEISAAGPSASAYTAFITTIGGRPVVEMSESASGKVWVAMTSSTAAASATARPANNAAADPASSSSESSGSSTASESASSAACKCTTCGGRYNVTYIWVYPCSDQLAGRVGDRDKVRSRDVQEYNFSTDMACWDRNAAAAGVSISRPLLTSVAGALGAVAAGALML